MNFLDLWWPPDKERIDAYAQRELLYEGDHKVAFAHLSAKMPDHLADRVYLALDYPKLIVNTFADLLFAESPVLTLPGQQEFLDRLVEQNNLFTTFYEAELSCSFRGDAVYRVGLNAAGDQVKIEEKPAWSYFVEINPDNVREVLSECLAWEREIRYRNGDTRRFLRVERHKPGFIYNELYEREGLTKVVRQVPLSVLYGDDAPPDVEETGVPFSLLIHAPNVRHGSRYWGQSDLTDGLIALFDEINGRATAISDILDKHADPKLVAPLGTVGRNGKINHGSLNLLEVSAEEAAANVPRYLVWDAKLEACFDQLDRVEDWIFKFSDVSQAMHNRGKVGNIDSGIAMKQLFMPMLTRSNRKALYRQPVIQRVIYVAMMMAHRWLKWPEPSGLCEVVWRSGLPRDDSELTSVATQLVQSRLMSRHTAVRYVHGVGDTEASAELARVDAEEVSGGSAPESDRAPGPVEAQ